MMPKVYALNQRRRNRKTVYCPDCNHETLIGDVCRIGLEYVRCEKCREFIPVTLEKEIEWLQYRAERRVQSDENEGNKPHEN